MTRSYDRDAKHYDRAVLTHLVETGLATFYAASGIYVLKTEDGTFAVRPHQVIDLARVTVEDVETITAPARSPMEGYYGRERYDGEDTGPGGVVYDSMLALAESFLAVVGDADTDPLTIVRRMLDDESGEVEHAIREQVADARRPSRVRRVEGQEELLRHFGV